MVERQLNSGPTDDRVHNWKELERSYDAEANRVNIVDEDGNYINPSNPLPSKISIGDEKLTYAYEDTLFETGDSPRVLDVSTDLGRTSIDGYIVNDGTGDIKIELSNDGTNYGGQHTLQCGDKLILTGITVSKIRLTWVSDTGYRVLVI